jgi:hypothetical protein
MEVPDEFRCPITMEVMTDPVIGDDGHTYERTAIERALHTKSVSPMTRQHMSTASLKPNYALRSAIQRWNSTGVQTISSKPVPSAPTHSHTEYVLLITPEVQSEQERLLNKRPVVTSTSVSPAVLDEHKRRMCRVSIVLCLLIVVLIFIFHSLAS